MARDYFFQRAKHHPAQLPDFRIANLKAYHSELFVERDHEQKLPIRINSSF
jgi:hypothetical protein